MKYILSLFMCLFITGCQIPKSPVEKKQSTPTHKIVNTIEEKSEDTVFSTKYDIQQEHVYSNLNNTIVDIANQLFDTKTNKQNPSRVILTSFVDLNDLENTSTFGRLISESMFNELHVRKFSVTDFRGQDAVSVNEDGEFHITRDVQKLKDMVNAVEYILVGTYVEFEDQSLLINARIVDSISGNLFSSARVVYRPRDCALFGICKKKKMIKEVVEPEILQKLRMQNSNNLKNNLTKNKTKITHTPVKKINTTPIMIIEDN